MHIVQNESQPNEIQNALYDAMRGGTYRARICSAYISEAGSEIIHKALWDSSNGDLSAVEKTIVTSLDFGLTQPEALRFWNSQPNTRILISGLELLKKGSLTPKTAFHPKIYLFDKPNGEINSLVGSANLTRRGLTINSESAWLEKGNTNAKASIFAWNAITRPTEPLSEEILEDYEKLRNQSKNLREPFKPEISRVDAPEIDPLTQYPDFGDANLDLDSLSQMWIQSQGMQGGAGTQLELPRGAHRFFGGSYDNYSFQQVAHIAKPVLMAGDREWGDRPLTWHGDNAMERINLPSRSMGGFNYQHSLILFRRLDKNIFELRVYPWDSDTARAYVEASRREGLLFQVGARSARLVGLIP